MRTAFLLLALALAFRGAPASARPFRAGAAEADITPQTLPIRISGNFYPAYAKALRGRLCVRALALDDGATRVVIAVVDTLMMPRELLDRAKMAASRATGVPPSRMLISATHTHSAPAVMGALGTDAVPEYAALLERGIVKAVESAVRNLRPARAGWVAVQAPEHTHCRRWILRPDKIRRDPFGHLTVRANMHPGYQNPDFVGPAGPRDPELSLLSFRGPNGDPIALLANYSMHYVGERGGVVAPDYFGDFSELLSPQAGIVILSQGAAGDQHWMDYSRPRRSTTPPQYAAELAAIARGALSRVHDLDEPALAMEETELRLSRRAPDPARLAWAREIVTQLAGAEPRSLEQVYAREQILLHAEPVRSLKLQALRIGNLAMTAIPAEVFAITALKIKLRSPFAHTFLVELANGAEGYIPPPEQHALGGYTTWPARTAGLEVNAEPQIAGQLLAMLERLSGKPRRAAREPLSPAVRRLLRSKPLAFWPMDDLEAGSARDATGHRQTAFFDGVAAPFLEGHASGGRAAHFAGGRMRADLPLNGHRYTVDFWFWNGMPAGARSITGYLFARGAGDRLAIDGEGRLVFENGDRILCSKSAPVLHTWYHLRLVRTRNTVTMLLNDEPVLRGEAGPPPQATRLWFGGRETGGMSFEGKLDDIAVWSK